MVAGRKPVVGIIGGIGSGKSTVARRLQELGAGLVEADEIGHEVLRRRAVKRRVRELWGEQVFDPQGEIDRKKLGAIVFQSDAPGNDERKALESLVHPLIEEELRTSIERLQRDPRVRLIVVDAALLLESGWSEGIDMFVYVEAPPSQRLERVRQVRGWDRRQFENRESAQKPLSMKRQRADYVVDNSGSLEETLRQVERLYVALTQDLSD